MIWAQASEIEKYWTLTIEGIQGFSNATRAMILDTGVSYSLVPKDDYPILMDWLTKQGVSCGSQEVKGSLVHTQKCLAPSSIPPLRFQIKNEDFRLSTIELSSSAFLSPKTNSSEVELQFVESNQRFGASESIRYWVMGVNFLREFYSIYDFKTSRVGLVASK